MRTPDNCIVHLAENIKKAVAVPVVAVNKIKDLRAAESILQENRADLIAMGRPFIADPYFPTKAIAGCEETIRPCIYCCQGCVANIVERDAPLGCTVNPMVGTEIQGAIRKAERRKRVLVLGAGPAGIQAALTASARGHDVYLVDRSDDIGGADASGLHSARKKGYRPFHSIP